MPLFHTCCLFLSSSLLQAAKERLGIATEESLAGGAARKTGGEPWGGIQGRCTSPADLPQWAVHCAALLL